MTPSRTRTFDIGLEPRFCSTGLIITLLVLGGCSSKSSPDQGDASVEGDVSEMDSDELDAGADAPSADQRDASSADRRDAMPDADAEPTDAGACSCSFGFHQECAEDELCHSGHFNPTTCGRTDPAGGAINGGCTTPGDHSGAACTAQCSSVANHPCTGVNRSVRSDIIWSWGQLIRSATSATGEFGRIQSTVIAEMDLNYQWIAACNEFLKWTMVGLTTLCGGPDAAVPPQEGRWHLLHEWRFRTTNNQECLYWAEAGCYAALEVGAKNGTVAVARVDDALGYCGNDLPYGPPCDLENQEAALECVKGKMHTLINAAFR